MSLVCFSADAARSLYGEKAAGSVGAVILFIAYLAENAGYMAVGEDSNQVIAHVVCETK